MAERHEGEAAWHSTLFAAKRETRRIDILSLRTRSGIPFRGAPDA
jgi:hypothetical protein